MRAQAFVCDAYSTLFDVHSMVAAFQAATTDAEVLSRLWRTWRRCRSPVQSLECPSIPRLSLDRHGMDGYFG